MTSQRAYDEASKENRRKEIMDAARRLFEIDAVLPAVSSIAKASGIAKGTIYLYFQSREEIFAAIVLEGWNRTLDQLEQCLSHAGTSAAAAEIFPECLASLIEREPTLMSLDAILPELKTRMSDEARRQFHDQLSGRLQLTGERLEALLDLPSGRALQILGRSHALARGIWQSFDVRDPSCGIRRPVVPSFPLELREALAEYWRGACAS